MSVLIFIIGLIVGSFISALTYRWPEEISIAKGRSFCPKCKSQINWYDNIPVFSYLFLQGKCRNCENKISSRYPLIEFFTASSFLLFFIFSQNIFMYVFLTIFIAIFVIDLEHKYIPDRLTFWGLLLTIILLIFNSNLIFVNLLTGLLLALFLLLINLLTFGKGMGLGDVKLAIFIGTLLGFPLGIVWMFLSFIIGSIIGLILLSLKRVKFKMEIPFGPFLIVSVIITLLWGNYLINILFPYL